MKNGLEVTPMAQKYAILHYFRICGFFYSEKKWRVQKDFCRLQGYPKINFSQNSIIFLFFGENIFRCNRSDGCISRNRIFTDYLTALSSQQGRLDRQDGLDGLNRPIRPIRPIRSIRPPIRPIRPLIRPIRPPIRQIRPQIRPIRRPITQIRQLIRPLFRQIRPPIILIRPRIRPI